MASQTRLITGFLIIYSLLILLARSSCWRDPTSKFFQAKRAHAPAYSAHRLEESLQYADSKANEDNVEEHRVEPPALCIGIPSVKRRGISYLKSTLGSLQHGLVEEERARLRFIVLLAYVDQKKHPDYGQLWLHAMVDKVAAYTEEPERFLLAKAMERNQTHAVKAKFDYSVLLEECQKTNASYVLIAEDDVVFLDGWMHRTLHALREATLNSLDQVTAEFLYLRLFYYEGLLGWNAEAWPKYVASSLAIMTAVFCLLLLSRRWMPVARLHITTPVLILTTLVFTPLLILLFFATGANCINPQPAGVHMMSEHACCGQGLVFTRETVAHQLLPLFRRNRWSKTPTDSFIEEYADSTGGLRWALTPVVMQHVGGRSSHGKNRDRKFGKMAPNRIWNFGFEENDASILAAEHSRADYEV